MAYRISAYDGLVGAQDVASISTVKLHELGTTVRIDDKDNAWAGRAVYVAFPANVAVPAGALVTQVAATSSPTVGPYRMTVTVQATHKLLGVPVFVNLTAVTSVASVQYGWVLEEGVAPTLKDAIKAVGTDKVMLGAGAGRVKAVASAGMQVLGARFAQSSVTTTTSLVAIYYNRAVTQSQIT